MKEISYLQKVKNYNLKRQREKLMQKKQRQLYKIVKILNESPLRFSFLSFSQVLFL